MAIEKKEVQYAKEIDDVLVLVIELVKDLKAKKDISTVMAENIPNLLNALNGVDQVGKEFAASRGVTLATIGYRTGEMADAFLPVPAAEQPAPPAA